ncbi:MAG: sulfite exporter TauE/SafE family protein, partial [Candidatus Limnocylindria bacterium]
ALFMLAMALHLLRVHPIFRYVIIQPPRFITRRIRRQAKGGGAFAPAVLGAMTVFLPCGVTQAMMLLAINSGSPVIGAATLFTFTLATSPLFFLLGYFATKLGDIMHSRFTKFAAVGIAAIALATVDAGLKLANSPITFASIRNSVFAAPDPVPAMAAADGVQEARIEARSSGYSPSVVSIAAGEPARLVFVEAGGGCTLSLVFQGESIPVRGETPVELAPQDPGEIRYSCAMGMYGGTIVITDEKETAA